MIEAQYMRGFPKFLLYFFFAFLGLSAFSQKYRFQEIKEFYPDNSYEEIADRIACLEREVPLEFNEKVMAFVQYFSIKDRAYTKDIIQRQELYLPIFRETLKRHNLPEELKYLSIVESGLRPNAVSRANAVGLWQFIHSTGRMYGLQSNWYVDERMDPYEATDAACRFLKDLHRMFGRWDLAMAAYNCGPGNVRKAIRRSGYKKTFWEIYRYLPRETRSYVPQYVAITYLFNHLPEHGFLEEPIYFRPEFDTILISQYFHVETFANQVGVCVDDLLLWNSQIKRGALPEGTKKSPLLVPKELKIHIAENRSILYDTASKVGKKELEYLARNTPGSTYGREKRTYRVRSGDVLGTIARQYGVRVSDIRSWNNLRGNLIKVGQRLNIWVLPSYNSSTKKYYTSSIPKSNNKDTCEKQGSVTSGTYKVRSGDSLWSISKANNTTIEQLKKANKLSSNKIKPGQSLVIPD
ncbi:MAG: LysM peptidoglycan-binding domain-containing protein [Bacteroidota bacterium]